MFCPNRSLMSFESAVVLVSLSVGSRSWKLLYSSPLTAEPRPWTTGSFPKFDA